MRFRLGRTAVNRAIISCLALAGVVMPRVLGSTTYVVTPLGSLGGSQVFATGINSSGLVVGYSDIAGDTTSHAFLYDGTMHDLGTLGGSLSSAFGINNA